MKQELKLQLSLLNIKYQLNQINLDEINWPQFFIDASNNRVLFYYCKKIVELNLGVPDSIREIIKRKILPKGQEYIDKTKKTLEYLNDNLEAFPFLVCKTEKLIEYITFDVDVLFKKEDYKNALEYLSEKGGKYINCEKKIQGDIIVEGLLRMDMHDNFHWQKSDFISTEQLWENTTNKEVFGIRCKTPGLENEVILNLLNLIYERHYVPLMDYYFIRYYNNQINWDVVFQTAKNYQWEEALMIILNKLNQIHYFLFKEPMIDIKKYYKNYKFKKIHNLRIPFIFTYREGFVIFIERLLRCRYFRWYEFLYFLFAKMRFHIIKGKRVPIYGHWINL